MGLTATGFGAHMWAPAVASSHFMIVKLVAFETTTGAHAGFENSGVCYVSIHVDVLSAQKLLCFEFTSQVEDHRAVQLVRVGTADEAHLANGYAIFSTQLDTCILTQSDHRFVTDTVLIDSI